MRVKLPSAVPHREVVPEHVGCELTAPSLATTFPYSKRQFPWHILQTVFIDFKLQAQLNSYPLKFRQFPHMVSVQHPRTQSSGTLQQLPFM